MADILDEQELLEHSEQSPQNADVQAQINQEKIEAEQREALDNYNQRQKRQNQAAEQVKKIAKDQVKKEIKKGIWKFLAGTVEFWGPPLALIVGIAAIIATVIFIVLVMGAQCQDSKTVKGVSWVASLVGADFCAAFNGDTPPVATNPSANLDITISSAYRPGAIVAGTTTLSAHGRGEAVDIVLRNPTVAIRGTDPRIAQLVQIAEAAGFNPAAGDTLDEYTTPTEGATGGHVHIEFNLKPDGKTTYCDDTTSVNPPADLVTLRGLVPIDPGTSDPRVRPCMRAAIERLFYAAGVTSPGP